MTEHRIFVEWRGGAYVSSLDPDFQATIQSLVAAYGRPTSVQFRASDEGWVHNPPRVLALCPDCIAKVGGAVPVPEYVECADGEPCEAADHEHLDRNERYEPTPHAVIGD